MSRCHPAFPMLGNVPTEALWSWQSVKTTESLLGRDTKVFFKAPSPITYLLDKTTRTAKALQIWLLSAPYVTEGETEAPKRWPNASPGLGQGAGRASQSSPEFPALGTLPSSADQALPGDTTILRTPKVNENKPSTWGVARCQTRPAGMSSELALQGRGEEGVKGPRWTLIG